jgi:hypothetical protein
MNLTNTQQFPPDEKIPEARIKRLQSELQFAWDRSSRDDIARWGVSCGRVFAVSAVRRASGLLKLIGKASWMVGSETHDAYQAWRHKKFESHLRHRGRALAQATRITFAKASETAAIVGRSIRDNPRDAGVQFFTLVLVSLGVSGGPDGNGGAPDIDLMFGIENHRSLLSHSILMGAALETGILSLLELVTITHGHLPKRRDPLWDSLHAHAERIALSANRGASIGMAYHLLVDGLVQPAAYHDLPVSMPIEAHQTLISANAAAEVIDVAKKPQQRGN